MSSITAKRKHITAEDTAASAPPDGGIPATAKRQKKSGVSITIPGLRARAAAAASNPALGTGASGVAGQMIRESGMRIWNAVRATQAADGREVAIDFLKIPNKRVYPDYYVAIQNPIGLDDIKQKLERNQYTTLKAVKDDFDLCFRNALTYNVEYSPIWVAAKQMQKVAHKEYKALAATPESDDEDDETFNGVIPAPRAPPITQPADMKKELSKHLAAVITKLIKQAPKSQDGILLSTPFLVLPSKKDWPNYYVMIKKPIAFDSIQRTIKRKGYASSAELVADVELLFNNAFKFNEDHSPVWIAAQTLRPIFHQLMAELPPEFAPRPLASTTSSAPKIKLRVQPKVDAVVSPTVAPAATPAPAPPTATVAPPSATAPAVPQPSLALPAQTATAPLAPTPQVSQQAVAPATPLTARPSYVAGTSAPVTLTPAPVMTTAARPAIPSSNLYTSSLALPPAPTRTPSTLQPKAQIQRSTAPLAVRSPSPELGPTSTITSLTIVTAPNRRRIALCQPPVLVGTSRAVKTWFVRLGWGESEVRMSLDVEKGENEPEVVGALNKGVDADVKWNGSNVPLRAKEKEVKVDGKTNGFSSSGDESSDLSDLEDDDSSGDGERGVRTTRSGKAIPSALLKSRNMDGGAQRLQLGDWEVPLVVGVNTFEIKVGGQGGELWKVMVERVF